MRWLAALLSVTLLLPVLSLPAVSAEPLEGMIQVSGDWQGSVFGDVGGQDKINESNFGIVENEDGSVMLKSAGKRGKISSSSDGIAYYYRDVPENADFELSAVAHVDAWTADNQVSFGLMLRDEVAVNVSAAVYGQTDYVAAGALDQQMKGFARLVVPGEDVSTSLHKYEFDNPPEAPGADQTYELSIKKSGSDYTLKVGSETTVIAGFAGSVHYAGLFTARNTTVTFSDVTLQIEEPEEPGDWLFGAFGGNTGSDKNPSPIVGPDGTVTLIADNGGKLASSEEGLSFYYQEMPADANFEISAKATVNSFNNTALNNENQKAFGLMLKDGVGANGETAKHSTGYVAIGGFGGKSGNPNELLAFYKYGTEKYLKLDAIPGIRAPSANEVYDLKIKKMGQTYVLSVNGETAALAAEPSPFTGGTIYAGLYVAREANITFSNISIKTDGRAPADLTVDASAMKTTYLVGESFDPAGLSVKAVYDGGAEENLTKLDYAITGFDSSVPGTNKIAVHFNGILRTIDLQVIALEVTGLTIPYYPAKTDYYLGDRFDPAGLSVEANYNNGRTAELTDDLYTLSVDETTIDLVEGYTFDTPGTISITVTSVETPDMKATFEVTVKSAEVTGLEIKQPPARTLYYIGDTLDLDGLVVYAQYDDNSSVRLMRDEYAVSTLDTSSAGTRTITVAYKGQSASFDVEVSVRQLTGIEIATYPQTSFTVGDSFDSAGLVIAKVYDNGDEEELDASLYAVNDDAFDGSQPGVYAIAINPVDTTIASIDYQVTVREEREYEWQSIRFGQSTSDANNKVTVNENGSVKLEALGGSAGKVTGDHDGISFYYTEIDATEDNFVLSADIQVVEYAKASQDGQESFGLMARDVIGTAGDSSIFASNIAAVGGYSGGTKEPNGTQLFVRTGVTTPDGAGSEGIRKTMLQNERPSPANTEPAQSYRLTLAKTNSGFTGKVNDGDEAILYTPEDLLNVQDDKIYVGFYAARLATIVVSDISFAVTAAQSDAPRVEPKPEPVTPDFEIVSLERTPETAYELLLKANVDGVATVKAGQTVIAQDREVKTGQIVTIPATLDMNSRNNFSITLLPDDTQYLTSYDKIVRNFSVTTQSYAGDIYVSPTGTSAGAGSADSPVDLDTAIDYVQAGQRIVVQDGHYVRNAPLNIRKYNDGKPDAMKTLIAAPGARPVIDFDKKTEGVLLSGNYWHVKGIDFARSAPNTKGFTIGGSHNIVEASNFYEHGDTGLQISRTDILEDDKNNWPSYNLVLNSTSHDNQDPSNNNADGFAAKLTSGEGNVFRGCISYHNIDDGWDLYTKAGTGAIGAVLIEDSIAYENGTLSSGVVGAGDKNGFKLGGEGIYVPHVIRGSIAFGNGAYGFTSNSNPGVIARDNIAFNNARGNLNFTTYANIKGDFTLDGFVSYQRDYNAKDSYPASLNSARNYMFDGTKSANRSGVALTDGNFASLQPALPYERDEDGRIVRGDFLRFLAPRQGGGSGSGDGGSGGSGVSGSGSDGSQTQDDEPLADGATIKLPATLRGDSAQSTLSEDDWNDLLAHAAADKNGMKQVSVELAPVAGASAYALTLPASALTSAADRQIAIASEAADIMLPGNMLDGMVGTAGPAADGEGELVVTVARIDPATLPADVRERIGSRPAVALGVTDADGNRVAFDNPDAPVRVAIPYEPTAAELQNPEHIAVWYIDGAGRAVAVPNGRYDAASGKVVFTTTHFSAFAVVYVQKTFQDLARAAWARQAVEALASRGVIAGTSDATFSPGDAVRRADFVIMLVKALGLSAKAGTNFADVQPGAYYGSEVAIARKLGIVSGKDNGRFDPMENISRQDMFAMLARALRAAGMWEAAEVADDAGTAVLDGFVDRAELSDYATGDAAALVRAGLVHGDPQHRLHPLAGATRAEAAVMIDQALQLR